MSEKYPKPKTVSELLEFCSQHGMPLHKMRFFIGEDYPEAKAFGIFQDPDGDFVVYKNKADGSRAVRYKGPDEAFAVNEIYEKLRSEVDIRKYVKASSRHAPDHTAVYSHGYEGADPGEDPEKSKSSGIKRAVKHPGNRKAAIVAIALMLFAACAIFYKEDPHSSRGYYRYDDSYYYYDDFTWYYYGGNGWNIVDDREFADPSEHFVTEFYDSSYGVSDFTKSSYYDGYYERSVDDDYDKSYDYDNDYDDYDWGDYDDYDDWDYDYTDWNDDW